MNNCSFDEHLPPHSCIDSVIEVVDPRISPIQFVSGLLSSDKSFVDNTLFVIENNGTICAQQSLDYESQNSYDIQIIARLLDSTVSTIQMVHITVRDISLP